MLEDINTEYLIVAGIIALIVILFSGITGWIIKKRVRMASMFGRTEHKSGRLLGWLIIAAFFIEYLSLGYTLYAIVACFICWVIYLISHTLEKLSYGHYGPRG